MREYLDKMLKKSVEKASEVDGVITYMFRNSTTGELKDKELYDEEKNIEFIKAQEEKYLTRGYTIEEMDQVMNVGTFEKKRSVAKKIEKDRKKEFRQKMLFQANIEKGLEYNYPIETHAARLMLSLNYLSMQNRYKGTDLGNKMQTTAAMLGDIVKFGEKKVDYTPELFKASLYTVTTMFGYVTKNILSIRDEVKLDAEKKVRSKDKEAVDDAKAVVDLLSKSAEDLGNTMLQIETKASEELQKKSATRWADIYNQAKLANTFVVQKDMADTGAGTSVVYKLDDHGRNVYFKGKEEVPDAKKYFTEKIFRGVKGKEELIDYVTSSTPRTLDFLLALTALAGTKDELQKAEADKLALEKDLKEKEMTEEEKKKTQEKLNAVILGIENKKRNITSSVTQLNFSLGDKYELDEETALKIAKSEIAKEMNAVVVAMERAKLSGGASLDKRNFATEHLAFLFDSDDLVVKSSAAKIFTNEGMISGFVMQEGSGKELNDVLNEFYKLREERRKEHLETPPPVLSLAARDKFYKLKFMDIMAGQIDRHEGNVMVKHTVNKETGQITITDVIGIDNDMAFGNYDKIFELVENNEWKYDYCPRDLYECVMTITPELLTINMANYVEPEYIPMLVKRFEGLKNALIDKKKKLDAQHKDFFDVNGGEELLRLNTYNFHV